jgi:hypothetical protein
MHTHKGEEAYAHLERTILYALCDTLFTIQPPYIVNIPPIVPASIFSIDSMWSKDYEESDEKIKLFIKSLNEWTPAKVKGKPVKSEVTIFG